MFFLISNCPLSLRAWGRQAVFFKRKFLLPRPVWLCLVDSATLESLLSSFPSWNAPHPETQVWSSMKQRPEGRDDRGQWGLHEKNRNTHFYPRCSAGNVTGGRHLGWPEVIDAASCFEHHRGRSMLIVTASPCSVFGNCKFS